LLLLQILTILYGICGVISIIGYFPTIKDIYKHKLLSANILSYVLWTFTTGITFLYGLFILDDLLFRIVSGMNFSACAIVLILSLALKNGKKK
jgi:hypothetical protein